MDAFRHVLSTASSSGVWDGVVCAVRASPPLLSQFVEFAERELLPALGRPDEPRRRPSAGFRPPSHDPHRHAARA
jgi:hypothetical protein